MNRKRTYLALAGAFAAGCMVLVPMSLLPYVLEGPRWPTGATAVFELGLGSAGRTLIDGNTSWNTAAAPAFALWNQHIQRAQLTSRNATTGASAGDGISSIVFSTTAFGQSFGPHVLALTYYRYSGSTMTEADILFNQNQHFDSYRGSLRYGADGYAIGEIRRVLVHELGHAIGLNHPDDAGQHVDAIMNANISNREIPATDDISGAQSLYGAPSSSPTPAPSATPYPSGVTPPVLWQNRTTGARLMWGMNGTTHVSSTSMGVVSLAWNIVASGDFNSDGKKDIVWENTASGQRMLWIMNGASHISSFIFATVSPSWKIATAADFNGDGKPDIVWQSSTGQRTIWIMNGTRHTASVNLGTVSTTWEIVGSGDFNGDGKQDILWQSSVTGQRSVWFMNLTHHAGGVLIGSVATTSDIVGAGDFNNDGKPDILWQDETTGQRSIWLMNRTSLMNSVSLGTVSLQWDIRNY